RPPKDAVRIEEMVNYFSYDYPEPTDNRPFSITTDVAACPWAEGHRLVHIGLKGRSMDAAHQPPCNLVFLIDVSGSMDEPNKLPLVKSAFRLLTQQLRAKDRVAIVVYAGNAGVVLPSTRGSEKQKILDALDRLEAGGSTAGGEGIQLAYKIARENFLREGNNRVILATDGDFNVGVSSDGELLRLIEKERRSGVFLTALGFGMGNYKDSKMQTLADAGNGNYAYIDTALEAKRVLVFQMGATLFTIAKDVKIQVEFNPARVASYRLIGYEKRLLNDEDFNNDAKDAGEIGAGHTVTALYEVVPAGLGEWKSGVDPLKYQTRTPVDTADRSGELLTVKFRYKAPQGEKSHLITTVLKDEGARPIQRASENLRFAASVAAFGMILRESPFIGKFSYDDAANLAAGALGDDPDGYRAEFVRLVKAARGLDEQKS
ncbi:MAG: von Willebrand factor type A domain-containing protein, partial [Elusimicrobia bacterium]|nr:von Willebrand factor type A domain-containing protein [Elusimicrobiota bacterium]